MTPQSRRRTAHAMFPGVLAAILAGADGATTRSGSQTAQGQPPRPTFRVEATFVRVDVYPTRNGAPVTDLARHDFEVFEDGRPQRIETFEHIVVRAAGPQAARVEPNTVAEANRAAADPRSRVFVVFLDTYHVGVEGSFRIRRPLVELLDKVIGQDDLVAVMTPEMSAADLAFARRTESIEGFLTRHWEWGRRNNITRLDPDEERFEQCYPDVDDLGCRGDEGRSPKGVAREMVVRRREKLTLDALEDLVTVLRYLREERKAIIAITDGWVLYRPNPALAGKIRCLPVPGSQPIGVTPGGRLRPRGTRGDDPSIPSSYSCDTLRMHLAYLDNERQFRDLLNLANRANASFYPIDPRGLPVFDQPIGPAAPAPPSVDQERLRLRIDSLRTLADATDGLAVVGSNDLAGGMKRIVADLSSYYLLGYHTTNSRLDGKYRAIKVRVKRPGVEVRARPGYLAAREDEVIMPAAGAPPPDPETEARERALDSLGAIRPSASLRVRAVPVGSSARENARVHVVGELDLGVSRQTVWQPGGEAAITFSRDGDRAGAATVPLASGRRVFSTVVSGLEAGDYLVQVRVRSAVSGTLPLAEAVRVAVPADPPLVGQALLFRRGPSTGTVYEATADPRFRRNEWIRVVVPVDAVAGTPAFRLLDRNGQPLEVPVAPVQVDAGASGLASDVGSAGAEPGSSGAWRAGQLSLGALAPADYLIEVTAATADGRTEKMLMGFRVIP